MRIDYKQDTYGMWWAKVHLGKTYDNICIGSRVDMELNRQTMYQYYSINK